MGSGVGRGAGDRSRGCRLLASGGDGPAQQQRAVDLIGAVVGPGTHARAIVGISAIDPAECAYVDSATVEYQVGASSHSSTWQTSDIIQPPGADEDTCLELDDDAGE